ncbi:hypothetical protein PTIM40_191 [Cyanophage P-TIM40]|uniref:Uncharacterized protein n=1 Tax=Cyanophage P-TIM40 TaxID=1589733 RepID=A0A0C5AEC8_9CAUD|nr:major head protein [Cyanophage P-TIM40]AJK27609.1 hypothetical protein PTIM40_191 [Cyanophage P-TIM40]
MSAGNGGFSGSAAATGPVAGFDPMLGGKKVKKRKYKPKGHVITNVGIGEASHYQKDSSIIPYLIHFDGIDSYVLYGKSPSEIKIQLRKIYRPEVHNKIKITRLYPNQVIKFYWDKRQKALGV